jgi:hypothetical protein
VPGGTRSSPIAVVYVVIVFGSGEVSLFLPPSALVLAPIHFSFSTSRICHSWLEIRSIRTVEAKSDPEISGSGILACPSLFEQGNGAGRSTLAASLPQPLASHGYILPVFVAPPSVQQQAGHLGFRSWPVRLRQQLQAFNYILGLPDALLLDSICAPFQPPLGEAPSPRQHAPVTPPLPRCNDLHSGDDEHGYFIPALQRVFLLRWCRLRQLGGLLHHGHPPPPSLVDALWLIWLVREGLQQRRRRIRIRPEFRPFPWTQPPVSPSNGILARSRRRIPASTGCLHDR